MAAEWSQHDGELPMGLRTPVARLLTGELCFVLVG